MGPGGMEFERGPQEYAQEELGAPSTAEMLTAWLERSNAFYGAHDRHVRVRLGDGWVAVCRSCGWESKPQATHVAAIVAALDHPAISRSDYEAAPGG